MEVKIDNIEVLHNYIHGRHGTLRLEAPSGKSHTYVFCRPKDFESFPDDIRFVYALHDNCKLFYIGMLENGRMRLTAHSRFAAETEIYKGAKYLVECSRKEDKFAKTPMKIYHNGRCCLCGRELSSEKSLKLGYGKNCKHLIPEICGQLMLDTLKN